MTNNLVESDFLDLMDNSITVEPWTGQDGYAKPTYGTAVKYQCRVVSKIRMMRSTDGQERVSSRTIYLAGDFPVDPKDRLTMADGTQPQILSVDAYPDENGPANHHRVVFTQ